DVSNLQRQVLFATADVAQLKTEAALQRLSALNPDIKVIAHQVKLCASNVREIFDSYDIVLDGTDRFGTRYLTNDACVILGKPLVSAAVHRFEGQAMTYVPGHGPCYRCLFPEPPADGLVPNCAEAGVLGVLPGVLGTIQATERSEERRVGKECRSLCSTHYSEKKENMSDHLAADSLDSDIAGA